METRKTWVLAGCSVLLWSTVATAFKIALREQNPSTLLFVANLVSVAVLLVVLAIRSRLKTLLPRNRKDAALIVSLGLLNPFIYYSILFRAYDLLPASVAQPLNYTWAIVLSVLAVPLQGKELTRNDIVGGLVAYAGVWIICTHGSVSFSSAISPEGVALALGSTLIWALYWILLAKSPHEPDSVLAGSFIVSLPFTFGLALLMGFSPLSVKSVLSASYVGVFEMGLTFLMWGIAVRSAKSPAKVASLIFVSPFLSLVFISTVLGEQIAPSSVFGLIVICVGLLYQHKKNR